MLDVNILKTFKKRTLRPGYLQSGGSALPKAVGLFSGKDEADTWTRLYLLWIPRVMVSGILWPPRIHSSFFWR